ncbi:DNA polymerase II [Bacillus phage Janet]|nr:DNA polymerase II [Bacillus phage Janet]
MLKILFAQEFIREDHMKIQKDKTLKNVFLSTDAGGMLKSLITTGLGLKRDEFYIDYAFHKVPRVTKRGRNNRATQYAQPKTKELNPEFDEFRARIIRDKPDIVVPSGNLGCKALINKASISTVRGVPRKEIITSSHTEEIHECWILPMYSMEYMLVSPKIQNLVEADLGILKKYITEGEVAFLPKEVSYEDAITIERVREIFQKEVKNAPVVAWDLETNTLHPERIGAKPLVISLSWREGQGVTIPLEHKEFTWHMGYLAEIYKMIEEFVGDPNIIKVAHNGKFDMRFLRLTRNITVFNNVRDTKTMYYLLVNQDVKGSLKLSDLTYEFTDMGGYDRALEDFKKKYLEDAKKKDDIRIKKLKEEWKAQCDRDRAEANEKIKEYRAELRELNKQIKSDERINQSSTKERYMRRNDLTTLIATTKYVKPKMPDFGTAKAPRNEIDGEDFNYEWIPLFEMLSPYASGDVDVCLRIYNALAARCTNKGLAKIEALYTGHYPELVNVLAKIEATGIKLDIPYVKHLAKVYTEEENRLLGLIREFDLIKQVEEEKDALYALAVEEMLKAPKDRDKEILKLRNKLKDEEDRFFNPNSSEDKQKAMYKLGGIVLPFNREYLVDSAVENNLEEHEIEWYHYKADKHAFEYISENYPEHKELADLFLEFSLVKTRKQSFTYKFLTMVDHNDILHGSFNSEGTETSRLSSAAPNLQNLPRKTGDVFRFDYQHPIKRAFVTRFEGGALIQLDYSSLESRVMALDAYDVDMIRAFFNGEDVHKQTASFVFRKPQEEVTDDERSAAKSTSFGLAYGETPQSYYSKHGMTLEQATKLFDDFFAGKPRLKEYIDENKELALQQGNISCMQGFTRNLRDVYSKDKQKRNAALRQATNTRIQGSGAFLTNNSLIYINNMIEKLNLRSRIVLTVHDSIVIDCPPDEIELMAHIGKRVMENLPIDWLWIDWEGERRRFPITADVEIGITYNDMVDYKPEDLKTFKSVKGYCEFYGKKKHIKNCKGSKVITEEKMEELFEVLEKSKDLYRQIA